MKIFIRRILPALAWCIGLQVQGQINRPADHLRETPASSWAITHAQIVIAPGKSIAEGTLLVRDGKVAGVQSGNTVPAGYTELNVQGAWVFPALIDIWTDYGQKDPEPNGGRKVQYDHPNPGPYHWNEAVKPEYETANTFSPDAEKAKKMRAQGFATVQSLPMDGIFRGTSAWVDLSGNASTSLLKAQTGSGLSFHKGISKQEYPESLMGIIALIRQTFIDVNGYIRSPQNYVGGKDQPSVNLSLYALAKQIGSKTPFFFETGDYQHTLRAEKIAQEARVSFIYKTKGDEYNRLSNFKSARLIIPLNFPKAYDFSDPADARNITLGKLKAWEQAPANPANLQKNGTAFAFTSDGLENMADFWPMVQKAIRYGLSEDAALAALTTTPAKFLEIQNQAGTLEAGKRADFFIISGNPFQYEDETIYETWIGGERNILKEMPQMDLTAEYSLDLSGVNATLILNGKDKSAIIGTDTLEAEWSNSGDHFTVTLGTKKAVAQYRLSGSAVNNQLDGYGEKADGTRFHFTGKLVTNLAEPDKAGKKVAPMASDFAPITFPNKAFGLTEPAKAVETLIRNATVWTNDLSGKQENSDVLLRNGKVQQVGKNLVAGPGAKVIDGTGLHVTPGIIDEHSHIAISRGVNEGSNACTAEVRIGDVVNCEDINIYRQLAGGVTASQLLHGSANPIGGQSALIKLRWGSLPEEMKIEGAKGYIKFALGENVKQSNWGNEFNSRYPQTRLGVEQFMQDVFQAALDYRKAQRLVTGAPPRDLQQEAVLEIIDGKRFVTCHSYVQSEINMLMHLAVKFGFRINTFTHILEGYKVAGKMKEHGVNGSTFSDWWAYKYEVIDAIPYNATLMHEAGINVCINSDDAEMGRRLNQEAAKSVKFGGMSEEDALKMVTLNPAKALRLDNRMGKIAPGYDADVVVWTDHPLSIYARPQQTFVDGKLLFDLATDEARQKADAETRLRIIRKMIEAPDGEKTELPAGQEEERLYHCDTEGE